MPLNTRVFAAVPSSVKVNEVSGEGEPTNGNSVEPSALACFTIVIDEGRVTAALLNERSLLPELQFSTSEQAKSINRM